MALSFSAIAAACLRRVRWRAASAGKTAKTLPPLGIRSWLALVVLSCVIPTSLGMMLLIIQEHERERARAISNVLGTARALAQALDRDFARVETAAWALAGSRALSSRDLHSFYGEARAM